MKLIAQKPCSFGGRKFFVGNEIPVEMVANPKKQERMGVIAISEGESEKLRTGYAIIPDSIRSFPGGLGDMQVSIPIESESGTQALSVAPESITEALRIMQMDVKEAEKVIENVEDENVLIILHACDSRKGIKNASEKKALTMQHPEEPPLDEEENMEGRLDLTDMEESEGDA